MFAIVQNNTILKTIQPHTEFELFGKTYNAKWTVRMTDAEKAALGIKDIVVQPKPDERFYWVQENPIAMVEGKPTQTYTATPKLLDDREELDDLGNYMFVQVYDPTANDGQGGMVDSDKKLITRGLKSQWIDMIKAQANSKLAATDWYVIRKAERDIAIPAEVIAERQEIVTNCNQKETAIKACTTVEELIQVVA